MSATPRPWVDEPENPTVTGANGHIVFWDSDLQNRDDRPVIVRAVNAFDALLAVVRGANQVYEAAGESMRAKATLVMARAFDALDREHPGWREWDSRTNPGTNADTGGSGPGPRR